MRVFDPSDQLAGDGHAGRPGRSRPSFGAELPLDLPFPVAAKTGTSSGFADTITVAATREAIVAAWAGAFDGAGTRGHLAMWSAAPLVRGGLLAVADQLGAPLTLPPPPPGVVSREVCAITGQGPAATCPRKREHFSVQYLPTTTCAGHRAPSGDIRAEGPIRSSARALRRE